MLQEVLQPVRRLLRRYKPNLEIDGAKFEGFENPLLKRVAETRFYRRRDHEVVRGWLTPRERQTLYALGRWLPGPITEIGPWVGLSTIAIAQGIKDSKEKKQFVTLDLGLTVENFRPMDGGYGMFIPDHEEPLGICSVAEYQTGIFPVLAAPGGQVGMLRSNLVHFGVEDLVEFRQGDFKKSQPIPSSVVFCDALHDVTEINANAPHLMKFLKPGSILACHDVGGREDYIAALRKYVGNGHGASIDSLFIVEIK